MGEADRFRSRLSKAEDETELGPLREAFVAGAALTVGASPDEAEQVFAMCARFKGYGFAESHSWAFAGHCYSSAWMRQHHPAAYVAGVLTEDPGMWSRATLVQEARRWGVQLAPVCVNRSSVSYRAESGRVVRVPLTAIEGLSDERAREIVQERLTGGKFAGLEDFYDRVELDQGVLDTIVKGGAFDAAGEPSRRRAFYTLQTLMNARKSGTWALLRPGAPIPDLPDLTLDELLRVDLATKGLSESGRHPLDAHRTRLRDLGCVPLTAVRHGQLVWTVDQVIARQKPPSAVGFAFFVLEDRATRIQAIISPDLWTAHLALLRDARALIVHGQASARGRAVTVRVLRLSELPLGQVRQAAD